MFAKVPAAQDLAAARNAYEQAEYREALGILNSVGGNEPAPQLLRARILLRTDRATEALRLLLHLAPPTDTPEAAERSVLLGAAYGYAHDFDAGLRELEKALAASPPAELKAEAQYYRALIHWLRYDNMLAEEAALPLLEHEDANERARARILLAWIAIRRHDLPKHVEQLLAALDELERAGEKRNGFYVARTLNTLSAVCREMPLPEIVARMRAVDANLVWTSGMQADRFHFLRSMAWIDALGGDHVAAFRQLKEASIIAPSDAARVFSLADRAYLARCAGEAGFFADQLGEAHHAAQQVNWEETGGEERAALVVLAQLFSTVDAAEAIAYLERFRALQSNALRAPAYAMDARVRAFADHSEGVARLHLGESEQAEALLRESWSVFEEFSYVWRAALSALHLYEVTNDRKWLEMARKRIEPYPRSWIAGRVEKAEQPPSLTPRLTPSQRQVFDLMCEGTSTNDIAKQLQRSPYTVRNHISDILEAFGVRSRSELFALLRRQ